MKFLYKAFLGKFCLFSSGGFLSHIVVFCFLFPFRLAPCGWQKTFVWVFLHCVVFLKFKKQGNKTNKQLKKHIGKQKLLCIMWRWQGLQVNLLLSCYQSFEWGNICSSPSLCIALNKIILLLFTHVYVLHKVMWSYKCLLVVSSGTIKADFHTLSTPFILRPLDLLKQIEWHSRELASSFCPGNSVHPHCREG